MQVQTIFVGKYIVLILIALSVVSCTNTHKKLIKGNSDFSNIVLHSDNHIENVYADQMFNKGLEYIEHKDYTNANECFLDADSANPNTPVILNALGNMELLQGDTIRSLATYKRALKIDSHFIQTYVNYGLVLNDAQKYEEAKKIFFLGLRRKPISKLNRGMLYVNLSHSYYMLLDKAASINLLDSAEAFLPPGDLHNKIIFLKNRLKEEK